MLEHETLSVTTQKSEQSTLIKLAGTCYFHSIERRLPLCLSFPSSNNISYKRNIFIKICFKLLIVW